MPGSTAQLSGALTAELLVLQRPTRQAAALVRRRPGDYVGLHWWRAVSGAFAVAAIASIAELVRRDWRWWYSLVGPAGTVLAAGDLATGLRALVDRPALDSKGHLRDVDEAFRSYGAHHLMGASVGLAGVSASIALDRATTRYLAELRHLGAGVDDAVGASRRLAADSRAHTTAEPGGKSRR